MNTANTNMTTAEVASILRISMRRIQQLAQAGELKTFRPQGRRRWLFSKSSVAKYLGCDVTEL